MEKVFVLYKLKPGVSIEQYRNWSVNLDQKVTPFQPGVHRFEVYEIKGAEIGESPYRIIEDVDVDSWDEWQKVMASDAMKEILETWDNYGDRSTIIALYGKKIK